MTITVASANEYFTSNFLRKAEWELIPAEDIESLLATAEEDIITYLMASEVDADSYADTAPFTPLQKAIFEWALFLYTNKTAISAVTSKIVTGASRIKVDEVGEEQYPESSSIKRLDSYNYMISTSPAARFLRAIPKDVRIIR